MKEDELYEQRKTAIHLIRSGLSKLEVASRLHRSPEWIYTWWRRYNENKDFTDLRSHSKAAKHSPRKFSEEIRREVKIARSELEAEKAESKTKVHIGVEAVRERLKTKGLKKIPSTKSIERILKESGMSNRYLSGDEQTKPQPPGTKTHRTKMMEGSHKKTGTYRQLKSGRNTYTSQVNSRKQNPSWTFKLLQGKVGLDELNKRVFLKWSGKIGE